MTQSIFEIITIYYSIRESRFDVRVNRAGELVVATLPGKKRNNLK